MRQADKFKPYLGDCETIIYQPAYFVLPIPTDGLIANRVFIFKVTFIYTDVHIGRYLGTR